jgi:hypothetical protein
VVGHGEQAGADAARNFGMRGGEARGEETAQRHVGNRRGAAGSHCFDAQLPGGAVHLRGGAGGDQGADAVRGAQG